MAELVRYFKLYKLQQKKTVLLFILVFINLFGFIIFSSYRLSTALLFGSQFIITSLSIGLLLLYIRSLQTKERMFKKALNFNPVKQSLSLFYLQIGLTVISILYTFGYQLGLLYVSYGITSSNLVQLIKLNIVDASYHLIFVLLIIWFVTLIRRPKQILNFIFKNIFIVILLLFIHNYISNYAQYLILFPLFVEIRNLIIEEDK